jgi:hypothetical protein
VTPRSSSQAGAGGTPADSSPHHGCCAHPRNDDCRSRPPDAVGRAFRRKRLSRIRDNCFIPTFRLSRLSGYPDFEVERALPGVGRELVGIIARLRAGVSVAVSDDSTRPQPRRGMGDGRPRGAKAIIRLSVHNWSCAPTRAVTAKTGAHYLRCGRSARFLSPWKLCRALTQSIAR